MGLISGYFPEASSYGYSRTDHLIFNEFLSLCLKIKRIEG